MAMCRITLVLLALIYMPCESDQSMAVASVCYREASWGLAGDGTERCIITLLDWGGHVVIR